MHLQHSFHTREIWLQNCFFCLLSLPLAAVDEAGKQGNVDCFPPRRNVILSNPSRINANLFTWAASRPCGRRPSRTDLFGKSKRCRAAENLPNVISVDPGDKDLPLVVVDEQSSNHDGCLSVPTCHRETKCGLGETERCSRVLQEGAGGRGERRREGETEK